MIYTRTPEALAERLMPYRTLEAWRGFASLWVVLFHTANAAIARYPDLRTSPVYAFSGFGSLGVQLFFVISGYCIATAACNLLGKDRSFLRFLRARLRRIYPPFWCAWLIAAAITILAGFIARHRHMGSSYSANNDVLHKPLMDSLLNLTLTQVPAHRSSLIPATWTLSYEIAFYVVVSLFLLLPFLGRHSRVFLTALHMLTVLALLVLALVPKSQFYPLDLWPQFGLGIIIYDVVRHPGRKKPLLWLGFAAALFLVYIIRFDLPAGPQSESSQLTFAVTLGFGLLLLLLHRYDETLARLKVVQIFSRIGQFSYSLYLVHMLVIGLINQVVHLTKSPERFHLLWFGITVLLAVAAGRVFYQYCERPFVKPVIQPASKAGQLGIVIAHTAE